MYRLSLQGIGLDVYLGVFDFEQQQTQHVEVDICLDFLNRPRGCHTDAHEDVLCYAALNDHLIGVVKDRRFQLIEYLCCQLSEAVMDFLKSVEMAADIRLTVHKNPPLDNIKRACFTVEKKWCK
ncbi:MAG: dihydroneopterin aldolase [Francisellaceae bacterium]